MDIENMQFKNDIKALKKEFDGIFKFSPIGICKIDIDGKIISANPEAAWMLGYESPERLIDNMVDITSKVFADKNRSEEFLFRLFEAEEVKRFRCQFVRHDNSLFWVRSYAKIIFNDAKQFNGFYIFLIDISDTVAMENKLKEANDKLKDLSAIDGLTQIANRRKFDEYCALEYAKLIRTRKPFSIIMCDVDYFKGYNDNYGHQAGDECLKAIAKTIQSKVKRPADLAARYGGEEFVVVLSDTDSAGAMHIAENIRKAVKNLKIIHAKSTVDRYVTISLGVASMIPVKNASHDVLVGMADKALYKAKESGRNKSVLFS